MDKQQNYKHSINIEEAIKLTNKRSTTVNTLCQFIFKDVKEFQNSRETFYLNELKEQVESKFLVVTDSNLVHQDKIAEKILKKIEADSKKFCKNYANQSIDNVLDAINEKKFKSKTAAENLLILLVALKDLQQ